VENNQEPFMYTEDQLMARLKFFIGICLALTLVGIVFVVLYSLIFVTQPMGAIAPIDSKFFELIIPIATFLTGTLSGIMLAGNDKNVKPISPPAPTPPKPISSPPPVAAKKEEIIDDGEIG
jgi:ABC-type multidrug transport system permease subunit